jgi:hypothetical protein
LDWIERGPGGRPNPFRILRIDPIHELLDSGRILGDGKNFFAPCIKMQEPVNGEVIFCAADVLSATPFTYSLRASTLG